MVAPGLGILAAENSQECSALWFARSLVDNNRRFAFAFVYCSGPAENTHKPQPVETSVAVMTLIDLHPCDGFTVAMGWQRIELAGTSIGAVTIHEFSRLNHPFHVGHNPSDCAVKGRGLYRKLGKTLAQARQD